MEPITLILLATLVVLLLANHVTRCFKMRHFPGPKSYQVIWNLLEFLQPLEHLLKYLTDMFCQFPSIFLMWLGPVPVVMVRQPRHLEEVLGGSKCGKKPYIYRFLKPGLGDGLITAKGHKWMYHRKLLTPTFHFRILENFLEVFARKGELLVQKLELEAGGLAFDIYPYVARCTLDIICETAMGYRVNALEGEESEYATATHRFTHLVMERARNALYHPDAIFWLSQKGQALRKCITTMHQLTDSVIAEKKTMFKTMTGEEKQVPGEKVRKAFLDLMMETLHLSDRQMRDEVHTFMSAGHETTTSALCWTLHNLGTNPDIQNKVQEELENIFQGTDRGPTMKDLSEMKIMERVIKETLRLYPPVPLLARVTTEDVKLDELTIPAGTTIGISIYSAHRNPEQFPDPEKFNPDNFLPERVAKRHPYAYIPFSAGPRNCIGFKFAMLEMKTVLSFFLRYYRIHSLQKHLTPIPSITLHCKEGFLCSVEKIKPK